MTSDTSGTYRGPQSEDVVFHAVNESLYYRNTASGAVTYVTVANDQVVLGFIWFADDSDAAGFVVQKAAGGIANKAAVEWSSRLRAARELSLSPSQAVQRLSLTNAGPMGTIDPADAKTAESLAALKAMAAR